MINLLPLTLEAKSIVKPYFKNITNSVYNFTTAFIWGGADYVKFSEIAGCLVLFYQFPNSALCASYPVGDGDKKEAVIKTCEFMTSNGAAPVMRNLSPFMAEELKLLFPDKFEYISDRNAFDYVYETKKLIELSGKELHAKRNHYNFFKKNYNYHYRKMTQEDSLECKELFDKWIAEKEESKWLKVSREATFAALDNLKSLDLTGGIIEIDEKICAFSVGEAVSTDTALIHLEVADTDFRGAFNAINQEFCAHEWNDFTYINREEDMGLLGLRKAKESYRPAFLIEKINARMQET